MKKANHFIVILSLLAISSLSYCQQMDKYPANREELRIRELNRITNLNIVEEIDIHRMHQGSADSISVEIADMKGSSTIRKKVRLDPEELFLMMPQVVYEYPDGKLDIDYEGLISILIIAYAEDQKRIRELEEQIKEISGNNSGNHSTR